MAEKPTNRERLQQITAGIEQGIKELFESEKYMHYLSVMSRFHNYSVNNTILIYMQNPDASLVAGYNKWQKEFERHVKKGEHGITIIAPTPYKKKVEEMKRDPDTHAPILDADGKVVMEAKEIEIPMFRPVKVFDVSQTDGKPLPELVSSLSGNVQNYEVFMEALKRSSPVPIEFEPMAADTDGYFSIDNQHIAIRQGMSEVQTVSATIHEIIHSKLHNAPRVQEISAAGDQEIPKQKDKNTKEVEAESISYAVCQYYGIQTGENSFGYIASWSRDKDLKELRTSLETINKAASELISDIDHHYKEICRERGIDLNARREPEQAGVQQELASQQIQEQVSQQAEKAADVSTQLPDAKQQVLDEYPMPDPMLTQDDLEKCAYLDSDLLPLSKERAYELMERDLTVYIIQEGKTPEMAFDTADLDVHNGIFAVSREEWEQSPQFEAMVKERMDHQQEREQAFLNHKGDSFAIYQMKNGEELHYQRFLSLQQLRDQGDTVKRENYDLCYTAPLTITGTPDQVLNNLQMRFDENYPADYPGRSVTKSDMIAIKQADKVSCYYCDSFGFTEIPDFLPENPLKTAELTVEDDYGMIDGILNNGQKEPTAAQLEQQARSGQPVSLVDLAVHREEQEKKKSVVERLKSQPKSEHKRAAPKKSEEREI